MAFTPSASYSLTVRAAIKNRPGMLGLVTSAIGGAGGDIRAIDLVELAKDIIVGDLTINARDEAHGHGILAPGRPEPMDAVKSRVAQETNPEDRRGRLRDAAEGADVFIGLSVPEMLRAEDVKTMARDPIVFAMANPVPEIMPEDAAPHVRVMATAGPTIRTRSTTSSASPASFGGSWTVGPGGPPTR